LDCVDIEMRGLIRSWDRRGGSGGKMGVDVVISIVIVDSTMNLNTQSENKEMGVF
jgi:hypothetical protein